LLYYGDDIIFPTFEQSVKSVELCQSLSDMYLDIHLFRFNDRSGEIYILAGEDVEVLIYANGTWRFINETEF
jgi:hypothetical protein